MSRIDPKISAEVSKAIAVANAGSALLRLANGNASPASIESAAFALFNAAASFSPEVARLSPYVSTGRQALDLFGALTTPPQVTLGGQNFVNLGGGKFMAQSVAGFSMAGSIAGFGASIAGLLNAPQGVVDALNGASLLFQGISLIGSGGMTVPIVGWAVSVVSFIFGLLTRNKEVWSKWQTIMQNVSVDGGMANGQVLMDDVVRQKTSSKKRNRVEYIADAAQTPLLDARFTIRPETVLQADPNASTLVVNCGSAGRGGSYVEVQLADGSQARLYSRGADENTGEQVWAGSDGDDGWISLTESQLSPEVEAPTGNYVLDLTAGFHAINPDVKPAQASGYVISAEQAAQLREALGGDSCYVPFTDGRIEQFRPWVNQMGEIRYATDHTTPNVYTYDDFNLDGVPDLVRQGVLQGLRVGADGKYEVTLNEHWGGPSFSYTADTMEEAYQTGIRSTVLMQWLASRPDLYDLYAASRRSMPAAIWR